MWPFSKKSRKLIIQIEIDTDEILEIKVKHDDLNEKSDKKKILKGLKAIADGLYSGVLFRFIYTACPSQIRDKFVSINFEKYMQELMANAQDNRMNSVVVKPNEAFRVQGNKDIEEFEED